LVQLSQTIADILFLLTGFFLENASF